MKTKKSREKKEAGIEEVFLTYANNPIWKGPENLRKIISVSKKYILLNSDEQSLVDTSVDLIVYLLKSFDTFSNEFEDELNRFVRKGREATNVYIAESLRSFNRRIIDLINARLKEKIAHEISKLDPYGNVWFSSCFDIVFGSSTHYFPLGSIEQSLFEQEKNQIRRFMTRSLCPIESNQLYFIDFLDRIASDNRNERWDHKIIPEERAIVYLRARKLLTKICSDYVDIEFPYFKINLKHPDNLIVQPHPINIASYLAGNPIPFIFRDYFNQIIDYSLIKHWFKKKLNTQTDHYDSRDLGFIYRCQYRKLKEPCIFGIGKKRGNIYCSKGHRSKAHSQKQ